ENAPIIEFKEAEPITIDDFAKIQMKVGLVVDCEAVPKSKLLHSTVKVGTKTFSILSGIAKAYTPAQMIGKKVVVVTNLPKREMKGFISEGMIVCGEDEVGNISLLCPERNIQDGSSIS
ncbi:MAG: methionine--tRNA ligase, partial [Clostridia bacterium]|nr:methionine--tRNA ligase [Clostridia bacterium]